MEAEGLLWLQLPSAACTVLTWRSMKAGTCTKASAPAVQHSLPACLQLLLLQHIEPGAPQSPAFTRQKHTLSQF